MAIETSALWRELFETGIADREYKFEINGVPCGRDDESSHSLASGLFDKFGIGNAVIGSLKLTVYAEGIPKGAEIRRYVRLYVEGQVSEWLPAGIFWPNHRPHEDGVWDIEAYDAMRKAEAPWEPDQSLEFPMSMPDAAAEIARLMGVELDSRTQLNAAYTVDYPATGTTQRQELQWIAAAHGGNWIITAEGKLRLVLVERIGEPDEEVLGTEDGEALDFGGFFLATRIASGDSDDRPVHRIGQDLISAHNNGLMRPVSRVTLRLDDDNVVTAGDDTGLELSADCPFAKQTMVDAILDRLYGYQYQMFDATAVNIDPAAELGDLVEADGIYSVLAKIDDDGTGYPDISAPGEAEMEEEYPSEGPVTRAFNRKIAQAHAAIEKSAEEVRAYVESEVDETLAEVDVKLGAIKLEVSQETGADGRVYANITLQVGPNRYSGQILMEGNLDVSGQLSADALYAALGDIANLTVNRFSTSRRIPLYLRQDTSNDNYIRLNGEELDFVTSIANGGTEQAVNPDGLALYWEDDPETGATLGTDGYPYKAGQRIFTTTKVTPWPVTVYSYDEYVIRSIRFDDQSGNNSLVVDTFGTGDGTGKQIGKIVKSGSSMEVMYTNAKGNGVGMQMGDYLDLYGLRKTTGLDFSGWDSGTFTETVEGIEEPYSYKVEFDGQGRPVKITDDDGKSMDIKW